MSDRIRPIIAMVESQREQVLRLVRYCEQLDRTKVGIVQLPPGVDAAFRPQYPTNDKACRAAFSLHWAARAMQGKPFIWLEHDAVPLKAGWAKKLADEYLRLGKPFMLSSDSNPPHDPVGGIGVYSGDAAWMIPRHFAEHGWDLWMLKNLAPLISRTPLIQHSYGVYDEKGFATPHRFPRDAAVLRNEALVFHRDVNHELMDPKNRVAASKPERVFAHAGDLGDIIYHLPVIERMGGGRLMLGSEMGVRFNSRCREPMTLKRVSVVAPLLKAQPYIRDIGHFEGQPNSAWVNLNKFRETFRGSRTPTCTSLQRACLRTFRLSVQDETKPWLSVDKTIPGLRDMIVVARSPRYHNPNFPWREIVQQFGKRIYFIGLPDEYRSFCREAGWVQYRETADLLEVARVIASAKLFIGNQSCPYAIAEGLKIPAVQESWPDEPNCLFQRQNLLNLETDFGRINGFIEERVSK